jgi:O-antigen/teichoic acid export membrane protein
VEKFLWKPWLRRALPVTIGYGAATYILALDMIVVQRFFPNATENGLYGAAGTIGRAVFFFLAPMTIVMFPKVAQSAVRSEKSSVLFQALGVTALMGVGAAICCTFLAELPFRIGYKPEYLPAARLVPLFAWCMLPLPLANVLVNNLLARERYGIVPWLTGIAIAYYFALAHVAQLKPQRFENIIYTLGAFGLLLLVVCFIYTVRDIQRLKPSAVVVNA